MATVSLASTANTLGPRRPGVTPLGIALVVQKRGTQTRGFELERVSRQLRDLNVYVVTITLNSQASRAKWSSALHHALQRAKHAVGDDSVPFIVGGLGDTASLAVELGVAPILKLTICGTAALGLPLGTGMGLTGRARGSPRVRRRPRSSQLRPRRVRH